MKRLTLFLALGLAATEKLDRTYLPPPGSKYAGGETGDLQVPLEFPKQAYTTSAPPLPGRKNYELVSFEDTRLVPGSFRRPGPDIIPVTPSSTPPFNYFQSQVPTTTTSYAFTQTTTFPPNESFETTLSPIFPVEGSLGEKPGFINPPFKQGHIFNQQTGQSHPSFVQPSNQLSQGPGFSPILNVSGVQTSFPGSQSVEGRPVYTQEQNINQNQQSGPISTVSPLPGSSLQPGIATSPYAQGYTQHLGVQPPRQYNQQGYFPSSTVVPGFPSQNNGAISNIQTTKVTGQQPFDYPINGPQQSTTQYVDKYGNVQNSVVPGFSIPQQIQQNQNPFHQPGLTQYGGNINNSIPGTSSSIISSQQGVPNLQSVEPQGSHLPHTVSHGGTDTGTIYGQRPQYSDQKGPFITTIPSQETNVPGTSGIQQYGQQFVDQQGPYLPTTTSGGILSNQGYQHPQLVTQQSNFPSTEIYQSTPIPGTSINQFQRPEFGAQPYFYPSPGTSQNVNPELISKQQLSGQQSQQQLGNKQPQQQLGGQQGLYPSTFIPGQVGFNQQSSLQPPTITPGQVGANQQSGRPQFIGQQGPNIPGQINYQQPESQNPRIIEQQNSLPVVGASQGSSIPGQTYSQQTQFNPQPFQTTGFVNNLPSKQGENVKNILYNIPGGSNVPGQKQYIENVSGTGSVPFGQPQVTDSRLPSQQPKTGDQREIPDSPLNVARPGTSVLPDGYQQPLFASTTPSSIPPLGTTATPGTVYPSVTPSFSGNYLGGRRPGVVSVRPERPQAESDRNAVILNYNNVLTPDGFDYSFDTSNGIHADENGTAIDGVKAKGSYSYIGDDGKLYSVVYTADENGFRPHGDHLPTPPPVPEAIQQVIEQAAKDKEAGVSHDGFYDEEKYGHKKYQFPKNRRPGTQNKVINGADINNEYVDSPNARDFKKKNGPGEERKNLPNYGKHPSEEYDNTRYNTDDHITEINVNGKIQKPLNRKNLQERPIYKKPGQYEYEFEKGQDVTTGKQPQITGQDSDQRRPNLQGKESPRRRPSTFSHKGKPASSKDQYDDDQDYDDKKNTEKGEKVSYGLETYDRMILSKTTGTLPGRFDMEQPYVTEVIKGVDRPIPHGTQSVKKLYDLKQTNSKVTPPQKSVKKPSNTFGTKYQTNDEGSEDKEDYEEPNIYDQENEDIVAGSKDSKKMRPDYTRNEFISKQKPGNNYQENTFDYTKYPSGSRFEQKDQTSYDQPRTENANTNIPEQYNNEEIGYQYTPPQNKFDHGEKKGFPSRFSDKDVNKIAINKYGTTVQPFITPNVHREGSYKDVSESGKMTSRIPDYKTTEDSSEYFDEQSEPNEQFDKENDSSSKIRPAKPSKTSVHRPGYQFQHTTGQPEYYDEYSTEKEGKTRRPSSEKPESDRYTSDDENQSTQQGPDQDYSEKKLQMSKNPSFTYTSSTTPMPFRKPYRPGYQLTSPQEPPQYSTTYEPSDSSSTEEDYNEGISEPEHSTSKSSSRRPVTISSDDSNTTPSTAKDRPGASRNKIVSSRPSYEYSSDRKMVPESPTLRPEIPESAFGKPSTRPNASRKPGYSTTTPQTSRPDFDKFGTPDYSENYDRKKPKDGSLYSIQDEKNYPEKTIKGSRLPESNISQNMGQSGRKDLPSTTYRPNYPITTISQPGSVAVNMFGRPLQPGPGSGTTQTDVSVSSGSPFNVYQDTGVIRPDQPTFKPTEPRFGGSVQGIPGQKPAEFGPSSFTTPGYLGPYGPSTGKIIGEDFSGPKQQQKYDPQTGYYY